MIPITTEQAPFRKPFYEVLVAWGGDFALANGVVGCTATASSAAGGHPAADVNNGDRTLLNNSWWESTNTYGKIFSPSTDGLVFADDFSDMSEWTAQFTVGGFVGTATSVADSPWIDFSINSTVVANLSEVYRRCTTSMPFNSTARTFSFSLKVENSRHHVASGTDADQTMMILCPTSVATSPLAEADYICAYIRVRENDSEFCVTKRISGGAAAAIFTAIIDETKYRDIRITLDSTNITIWEAKEGQLFSGAHGLTMGSWGTCYVYAGQYTYNTEEAKGSFGNFIVHKGMTQTFSALAACTEIMLQTENLLNGTFDQTEQFATQEFTEDFEAYTEGGTPYDWITGAAAGSPTATVETILYPFYDKGIKLRNTADQYTWVTHKARRYYDFEGSWYLYIKSYAGGPVAEFNQFIRADASLNTGYVLVHDPINSQFRLCRDMTAGVGQVTTLVTTAYTYSSGGDNVYQHTVRVVAKQNVIQVWIDGNSVCNYTDAGTARYGGFFGCQLKPGTNNGTDGWSWIDDIVFHPIAATLPNYWMHYTDDCGHALPVSKTDIVLFPENSPTRTTTGANYFRWINQADPWAVGVFDRDHRGGILCSCVDATGAQITGDTAVQTVDISYFSAGFGANYRINIHEVVGPDGGQYEIYVDGNKIGATVDQYAASEALRWTQLSGTVYESLQNNHTLQIKKLGTKNASSSDYYVKIDQIVITPDSTPISGNVRGRSQYVGWGTYWINHFENNQILLTYNGITSTGIKQKIIFPRGQKVYARFTVSAGNYGGEYIRVGDSITGIEDEYLVPNNELADFHIERTFADGAEGYIYLYISRLGYSANHGIKKLYIHRVDVWADNACTDQIKFIETPYTAGITTTGGTPIYTSLNLLTNPEIFNVAPWIASGATFTANAGISPFGNGNNAMQAAFAATDYVYQPVSIAYAGRDFTFSVWAKASAATNIHIGILDDLTAPQARQMDTRAVGTTWTRIFINVSADAFSTDNVGETLYAFIGCAGRTLLADLPAATVQLWGAQLCENGYSNILEYYRTATTDHVEIWEASQNLLIYSEQFDNAAWTKDVGLSVTADQYKSPLNFGVTTADKIITTGASEAIYQSQAITAPASNTFTFSVWLRGDTAGGALLEIGDGTATFQSNPIIITKQWQRFSFTATFASSVAASCYGGVRFDATGTFYAFGGQLEQKPYMTKYIQTVAATATRAATTVSIPTPISIDGTFNNFAITFKGALLADSFQSANVHTLFAIGNGATAQKIKVYIANGYINLYIRDSGGSEYTTAVAVPGTLNLTNEFMLTLYKDVVNWGLILCNTRGETISGIMTLPTIDYILNRIYIGGNTVGGEIGNVRMAEFAVWNRNPNSVEAAAYAAQDSPFDYKSNALALAFMPVLNSSLAHYQAGGNVSFTFGIWQTYPMANLLSFKKSDQWEVQESLYHFYGGTTWQYNYEWLLLTFAHAVTFNRLKIYEYPNADASLVAPYQAGKGGLRDWYLEYWNGTTGTWIPFFKRAGSINDLDIVDLTQLVSNGAFEDNISDWQPTNKLVTLTRHTSFSPFDFPNVSEGHSGNALQVNISQNFQAGLNGVKLPFTFVPGMTYTITCRVAGGPNNSNFFIRAEIIDGVTNPVSTTVHCQGGTWQTITMTYTTDPLIQKNDGWFRVVMIMSGYSMPFGYAPFSFLLDDVTIVPSITSITTTKIRMALLATQASDDSVVPRIQDPARIIALQCYNFYDESKYVKDEDIQITFKKTANTNFIAPSYFQVKLGNITKRFSPKNNLSPIYGYTQPDGRGFVRAGSLVEISGGFIEASGMQYKEPVLNGIIGSEANPAANTGIEMQSTGEEILLVGGDDMVQLNRVQIPDSDTLTGKPYEQIIQYACQLAGFAIQDMQLDMSGTIVPYAWIGGGTTALAEINNIIEASKGMFFAHPGRKKTLFYYDGVKFKSWLQTTKTDFDAGTLTNVTTDAAPGNVQLELNATTLSTYGYGTLTHMTPYDFANMLNLARIPLLAVVDYSVPNYHFNGNSDWTVQTIANQTYKDYQNASLEFYLIGAPVTTFSIRTSEVGAAPPQSLLMFENCFFDWSKPAITYSLIDEADNVLKTGSWQLLNSGEDGPKLTGATDGNLTNITIHVVRRRMYQINGKIYKTLPTAYKSYACGAAHAPDPSGYTGWDIVVDTEANSHGYYTNYTEDDGWIGDEIFACASTEPGAPGYPSPCKYYKQGETTKHGVFNLRNLNTTNYWIYAGCAGRCAGDDYNSQWYNEGWQELVIDYSDILAANVGKRVRLQLSIPAAATNPYGSKYLGGYGTMTTTRSFLLDPQTYTTQIRLSYALFVSRNFGIYPDQTGKVLFDFCAYGAYKPYTPGGEAITISYDTGKTTPSYGSLTWSIKTELELTRGESYQILSQTSPDNTNWYGQGGLNTWDAIFNSVDDPYSLTLAARIYSPQYRYVRFKFAFGSLDHWITPFLTAASFNYTENGEIISQVLDATAAIQSWTGFAATAQLPVETAIVYKTLSADDAGFTLPDPAGWQDAFPGAQITSVTKRYLKWKAQLSTTNGGATPTLADVTINWIKGLKIPTDLRYYKYDTRIESFDPRSGFPACNQCQVSASAYMLDLETNAVTAHWNGAGGDTAKTCGQQVFQYSFVPVNLTNDTIEIQADLSDPTLNPAGSNYSTYPRAFYITIGGVNYGVFGWDGGICKEGVAYTWAGIGGGNLSLTFSGGGKQMTITITATGTVSITDIFAYGFSLKTPDAFTPSQLAISQVDDLTSQRLYNQIFLRQINNLYIYSEAQAEVLAQLTVDEGKWIRDYGACVIPIEFSLTLQSQINIDQPNSGWSKQFAEAYEIAHNFSNMTTRMTVKEK
jgi:hypothetical protein